MDIVELAIKDKRELDVLIAALVDFGTLASAREHERDREVCMTLLNRLTNTERNIDKEE